MSLFPDYIQLITYLMLRVVDLIFFHRHELSQYDLGPFDLDV